MCCYAKFIQHWFWADLASLLVIKSEGVGLVADVTEVGFQFGVQF
jgi:hypothetical protein